LRKKPQVVSQCSQGSPLRGSSDSEDTATEGMAVECYVTSFKYLVRTPVLSTVASGTTISTRQQQNHRKCHALSRRHVYILLLSASHWPLTWLTFRHWRWRHYVPPKQLFIFNELHGVISQKTDLFKTTGSRTMTISGQMICFSRRILHHEINQSCLSAVLSCPCSSGESVKIFASWILSRRLSKIKKGYNQIRNNRTSCFDSYF
jgi:hypothetical protein